uniref:Uncharacterized protein n=1 Tax=Podoviridae sp. ctiuS14 TaxID=2827620 RepID=A0A8S5LMN0_9CAUD|nr:MAG TPA: hypothetical protein [Podoviridae sp. ctiuS14]
MPRKRNSNRLDSISKSIRISIFGDKDILFIDFTFLW